MQSGQQPSPTIPRGRIPYYKLRGIIEDTYNRPQQLRIGCIAGGFAQGILGLTIWLNQGMQSLYAEPWYIGELALLALIIVVWLAGVIAAVGYFVLGIVLDALSYTDHEEERVKKCLEFLEKRNYSPETLTAMEAMATHGVTSSQIFMVLPVALLTATATVVVIDNLPYLVSAILGELAALALLSFALSLGQANADVVIQKSVAEWRRRTIP